MHAQCNSDLCLLVLECSKVINYVVRQSTQLYKRVYNTKKNNSLLSDKLLLQQCSYCGNELCIAIIPSLIVHSLLLKVCITALSWLEKSTVFTNWKWMQMQLCKCHMHAVILVTKLCPIFTLQTDTMLYSRSVGVLTFQSIICYLYQLN